MGIWDNAFKIPEPPDPTDEEKRLLDELAVKVRRRGMGELAAMAAESTRPLHNLGAQGLVFLEPALAMLFNKDEIRKYKAMLENSKAVAYLVDRLNAEPAQKEDTDVKKRP